MKSEEIMRDVVGYEGLYKIDIFGNVYKTSGKEMSQNKNEFGYLCVYLTKEGKQKQHRVHRLVAQAFILNPQNKEQVNHIDGDKTHNAVWNLEWVTPKENTHHAIVTELRKDELRNLTNQRFGKLTVINYVGTKRDKNNHVRNLWNCMCDCGKEHIVTDNNLITGNVKSCGCLKIKAAELARQRKGEKNGK